MLDSGAWRARARSRPPPHKDGRAAGVVAEAQAEALPPHVLLVLDGAYEIKLASQQNGTVQKGGHFHADGTYHEEH